MSPHLAVADGLVNPETDIVYPRPSFKVTADRPGTDLVANAAAAFASGAVIYSQTLGDSAYAAKLLEHAKSLYEWATTGKQGKHSDSVKAARDSCVDQSRCWS